VPGEQNPNLVVLELVVERLGTLTDDLVFLGGCATGLLLTDPAAPPIRATRDVDVIAEIASLGEYHALARELRRRGFVEDQSDGAPICRWTIPGARLDVMPTNADLLGFGNEWYRPALASARLLALPSGRRIRLVTAAYFVVTKLAAFHGRGGGDYASSHDMEDIIAVLDGRPEIVSEIVQSDDAVRGHIAASFRALLQDDRFKDSLPGHLPGDPVGQDRVQYVLDRMRSIPSPLAALRTRPST